MKRPLWCKWLVSCLRELGYVINSQQVNAPYHQLEASKYTAQNPRLLNSGTNQSKQISHKPMLIFPEMIIQKKGADQRGKKWPRYHPGPPSSPLPTPNSQQTAHHQGLLSLPLKYCSDPSPSAASAGTLPPCLSLPLYSPFFTIGGKEIFF